MEDYSLYSDEQLQKLAVSGSKDAETQLVRRYTDLTESCARSYYLEGGDSSDLVQEGMLGLIGAIRRFQDSKGVPFRAYAELCIRRRIFSAIRAAAGLKHTPLNDGVTFEEALSAQTRDSVAKVIPEQRRTPEEQVLARESAEEFSVSFSRYLSPFEQSVLRLYVDGFSYRAIAQQLGREEKAVDNAVQRIRRKLAQIYSSGDFSES